MRSFSSVGVWATDLTSVSGSGSIAGSISSRGSSSVRLLACRGLLSSSLFLSTIVLPFRGGLVGAGTSRDRHAYVTIPTTHLVVSVELESAPAGLLHDMRGATNEVILRDLEVIDAIILDALVPAIPEHVGDDQPVLHPCGAATLVASPLVILHHHALVNRGNGRGALRVGRTGNLVRTNNYITTCHRMTGGHPRLNEVGVRVTRLTDEVDSRIELNLCVVTKECDGVHVAVTSRLQALDVIVLNSVTSALGVDSVLVVGNNATVLHCNVAALNLNPPDIFTITVIHPGQGDGVLSCTTKALRS